MSDAWGPSPSPPPPPGGQQQNTGGHQSYRAAVEPRRSGAFRDVLIIAMLAIAGVVGIVIWDGGDVSEGTETEPSTGSLPGQDSLIVPTSATGQPATAGPTQPVVTGTLSPGDAAAVQAMVAAQDALIGVLPVPAGGTEQPPTGPGVRSWMFAGTDWQSIRDAYVATLQQQGFTVELQSPVNDGTTVGELYTLRDPTGTIAVQLSVGTFNGQSGIEVTRQ